MKTETKLWEKGSVPLVSVTRGQEPDLLHRGMACLVDARGEVVWSVGDPNERAFIRSSAKPLQAFPVLTSGAAEAFGLDPQDIAIMCGSHSGGPEQVSQVKAILNKIGLPAEALGCGGGLTDECSGKHAGMLAGCRHLGFPTENYLNPQHPWQQKILECLCDHCGLEIAEVKVAEDGCSAPTYSLPIYNMALGFARLAKSGNAPGPSQRLLQSIYDNPHGHTGEPDLRDFNEAGDIITKGGANGIACAALPTLGIGFAMKIIDGSALPRWPVFIEALLRAGFIGKATGERMRQSLWSKINSRRGVQVGTISVEF